MPRQDDVAVWVTDAEPYAPRRPSVAQTYAEFAALTRRARVPDPDLAALAAAAPRGDGAAVLVLPTVFHHDGQTRQLRDLLSDIGYAAFGWDLGTNVGPTPHLLAGARARLEAIASAHGPVALVGFSMGGLFARWLAQRTPALVRQVITAGSPIRAAARSAFLSPVIIASAWRGSDLDALAAEIERPLPMPATCLYSRSDGIVAWQSCLDPATPGDNIEVACRHVTMPHDLEVFRVIADRLARPLPQPSSRGGDPARPDAGDGIAPEVQAGISRMVSGGTPR